MKVALIGLGVIGEVHLQVLNELGVELSAVCDVDEGKLKDFKCAKYTDYKKMLTEIKPNVVHVCTPHYLHADMVVYALNLGINVLCEKPLGISELDLERILKAEENSTAKLGVCMQNRYLPEILYLKSQLENADKKYGYATLVWSRGKEYYAQAEWRGKWATEGGGVLINQALHTFDILQWLLGYPISITANTFNMAHKDCIEVEDTIVANCKTENGAYTLFATNGSPKEFLVSLNVKANEKDYSVKIFSGKVMVNDKVIELSDCQDFYGKRCYGSGHKGLIQDFYDCVETGRKFMLNGTEAAKVVKMILAVYKSNNNEIKL